MLERDGSILYNTTGFFDRNGAIAGKYRKVQLPLSEVSAGISPGSDIPVFQTDFGKVALLICQDTAFPEPARQAAIKGAEMLLVPIWGGKSPVVAARAIEHSLYVAAAGYDYLSEVLDPLGGVLARVAVLGPPDGAFAPIDLGRRFREDWSGDWRDVTGKQRRTAPYPTAEWTPSNGEPPPPLPNAAPTATLTAPSNGATFTAPATMTISAAASDSDGSVSYVEFYAGGTLIATDTTSPYSITWSNVPASTYTLTARAVDNAGAMATTTGVTVTVSAPPPPPPALPSPWAAQDIGAVAIRGDASASGGTFTVRGSGADVWGTADAFQFVWQRWTGDGTITARVATANGTQAWVKAGVMIRERLTPDSPHAFMLVSVAKGLAFQRRLVTGD